MWSEECLVSPTWNTCTSMSRVKISVWKCPRMRPNVWFSLLLVYLSDMELKLCSTTQGINRRPPKLEIQGFHWKVVMWQSTVPEWPQCQTQWMFALCCPIIEIMSSWTGAMTTKPRNTFHCLHALGYQKWRTMAHTHAHRLKFDWWGYADLVLKDVFLSFLPLLKQLLRSYFLHFNSLSNVINFVRHKCDCPHSEFSLKGTSDSDSKLGRFKLLF